MTLVVPCVMTAMLIVLTFILPPDAGEKVGLSKYSKFCLLDDSICLDITILLAMVVFMDQLAQQTPPMPGKLPVIGQVNNPNQFHPNISTLDVPSEFLHTGFSIPNVRFLDFPSEIFNSYNSCNSQPWIFLLKFSILNFLSHLKISKIQFFVASMIIISVSMVTTIYCLKLHHTVGREAQAMPSYVRYVLLDLLPIVLFLHPPPDPPSEDSESLLKDEEGI